MRTSKAPPAVATTFFTAEVLRKAKYPSFQALCLAIRHSFELSASPAKRKTAPRDVVRCDGNVKGTLKRQRLRRQ